MASDDLDIDDELDENDQDLMTNYQEDDEDEEEDVFMNGSLG